MPTRGWPAHRRRLRAPGRGVVAATVLALVVGGLGVAATRSPGYSTDRVEPNDGTLWVTNDRAGLFGRFNSPAAALDAAFAPGEGAAQTSQLDVVQAGATVLTQDRVTGRVAPVDVQVGALAADRAVSLPPGIPLAVGGGTSATVDPGTGEVRAASSTSSTLAAVDGLSLQTKPVASLTLAPDVTGRAAPVDVAVDADGTAYAAGSGGDLVALRAGGDGVFRATTTDLGGPLQDVHVVLGGDTPVVLDTVSGTIAGTDGSRVRLDASVAGGVPQQDAVDGVLLVVTTTALLSVDVANGAVRTLSEAGTGPPAAPVVVDGCGYAVWSGSPGRAVRACDGGQPVAVDLEGGAALLSPQVRLNHRSVVLNDSASGAVWSLETGRRLDDWASVAPPSTSTRRKDPDQPQTLTRSQKPPKAVDDSLGARAGRTSVLHVLDNDSNPSGSVLSITRVGALPSGQGTAAISPDGQTVQVTLVPTAGTLTFDYEIDDGKGNASTAVVTTEVRGPTENGAPALRDGFTPQVTTIANRGSVSLPVVGDWRDPDSDPVAVTEAADDDTLVGVSNDGRLRYTAPADDGPRRIDYTVSDGRTETAGQQPVQILPRDSTATTAATALPDVGRGEVGTPVVLRPLENDVPGTDPTTSTARLQIAGDVAAPDGTTVETSVEAGTVSVTAGSPGTYLLAYTVRYGDAPFARGAIRVDVKAAEDRRGSITAMLDQAVVHAQTATTIDVLANDVDPAGGLLVVQAADAESSGVVDVAVLRGRWLRIRAARPVLTPNPLVVQYTVTNGSGDTATGDVSVLQLPEPADGTPVAVDDAATVRSGDHVSISALDNDVDPSGQPLVLATKVEGAQRVGTLPVADADGATGAEQAGAAYVAGSVVRYQAPEVSTQSSVTISYVVVDPDGQRATGSVNVTVVPPPAPDRPDRAPAPPPWRAAWSRATPSRSRSPAPGSTPTATPRPSRAWRAPPPWAAFSM